MDPCAENMCDNNSTCVANGMSYACSCPPGYIGSYCEECNYLISTIIIIII